jgi:protein-S-isoprenylcysteine O-methyltransferase Ste14
MTALVFSKAAAAWTAYAILLLSFAAELGTGWRAGARDRVSDRGTKYFLAATTSLAVLLSVGAAYLLPSTQVPGNQWIVFALGCAIALAGVTLRRWAIAMLGRFFTRSVMIREDHRVITGGPYRLLRHPAYSGTLLTGLGFGVMLGSWLSIAIMFIGVLVALLPRILHEERVLEASLGDPYRDFARGRKRLVPFVW